MTSEITKRDLYCCRM